MFTNNLYKGSASLPSQKRSPAELMKNSPHLHAVGAQGRQLATKTTSAEGHMGGRANSAAVHDILAVLQWNDRTPES